MNRPAPIDGHCDLPRRPLPSSHGYVNLWVCSANFDKPRSTIHDGQPDPDVVRCWRVVARHRLAGPNAGWCLTALSGPMPEEHPARDPYDYASLLHYHSQSGFWKGKGVFETTPPDMNIPPAGLSTGDVRGVARLYGREPEALDRPAGSPIGRQALAQAPRRDRDRGQRRRLPPAQAAGHVRRRSAPQGPLASPAMFKSQEGHASG